MFYLQLGFFVVVVGFWFLVFVFLAGGNGFRLCYESEPIRSWEARVLAVSREEVCRRQCLGGGKTCFLRHPDAEPSDRFPEGDREHRHVGLRNGICWAEEAAQKNCAKT